MLERNDFIIKDIGCGVADLAGIQVDPSTLLLRVTFATAATYDVFLPLRRWCPLGAPGDSVPPSGSLPSPTGSPPKILWPISTNSVAF
jgi:hypothetical protein